MEENKESFLDKKIELPKINFKNIFSFIKPLDERTSEEYNPQTITLLRLIPILALILAIVGLCISRTLFSFMFFSALIAINTISLLPLISDLHNFHCIIKNQKRKEEIEKEVMTKTLARRPTKRNLY